MWETFRRGSNNFRQGGPPFPKNFDKQKKGKGRVEKGGGLSIYSALVWSKSIFAIETALQTIIVIYIRHPVVISPAKPHSRCLF